MREFLATEVAGGVVLLVAALTALVWANSPWSAAYRELWESGLDLERWVNDGLMTLFFLVVALEIKRELLDGELRDRRRAALPVFAAVGGMLVPALLYLAVNAGGDGLGGWGIPMATDIAFALGVAALIGNRLPSSLRLFLLTLAIVDDIGAIVIIAVVYSGGIEWMWLAASGVILASAYAMTRVPVVFGPVFVVHGVLLWLAVEESGLHPTLAGVAIAFVTARTARLEHALHPWTSLVVVPLFVLANAGVVVTPSAFGDAATSPVTWGVVAGLVVGKTVGISTFAWLACRLGVARLPTGTTWLQLVGVATIGGIGFTVSLFVTSLAFDRVDMVEQAKVGVLVASVLASGMGALILVRASRQRLTESPGAASS